MVLTRHFLLRYSPRMFVVRPSPDQLRNDPVEFRQPRVVSSGCGGRTLSLSSQRPGETVALSAQGSQVIRTRALCCYLEVLSLYRKVQVTKFYFD